MTYTASDLQKHLKEEHDISPFATYLKEIVYGGNDGIVTTFAVVAGFAGANIAGSSSFGFMTVLLFGVANLAADATSMGLGNFLSMRAEQDRYKEQRNKEAHEVEHNFEMERDETIHLLERKGFTNADSKVLVSIFEKNKEYWIDFMMQYELEMSDPTNDNPVYTALATFLAFIAFGTIPIVPYIFFPTHPDTFLFATGATFLALVCLGLLRYKVTKDSLFRSMGEIVFVGGLSAAFAYIVGILFRI
jgi:VIT1/CCC1 family predicted Fe2+/Mn2+ transporter